MVVKSLPGVRYRRFTVDEYLRMIDLAILHEDLPVELIEGEVVVKGEYRSAPYRGTALIERYPFTRGELRRLRAAGLLGPNDLVEQRTSREWPIVTIGDPHCLCVDLLTNLL